MSYRRVEESKGKYIVQKVCMIRKTKDSQPQEWTDSTLCTAAILFVCKHVISHLL